MAAIRVPKPGARAKIAGKMREVGPCRSKRCGHVDCAWQRETAAAPCRVCSKPIGFDRAFYVETDRDPKTKVHAVCLLGEIEAEMRARR